MTEDALAAAIRAVVFQIWRMASSGRSNSQRTSAQAYEWAEARIMPIAIAMAEQAREEGFRAGRQARLAPKAEQDAQAAQVAL